jgi:hypothetical protein
MREFKCLFELKNEKVFRNDIIDVIDLFYKVEFQSDNNDNDELEEDNKKKNIEN